MAWTYSTSLATDKDRVRLYIGDTDTSNQLFSDEEIEALLTVNDDDVFETSAQLAESLAAKYARYNTLKIDSFSINYKERADQYSELAKRLRASAGSVAGAYASPVVTGISISEMDSVREDTDRNPSRFEIGKHTYPGNDTIQKTEESA